MVAKTVVCITGASGVVGQACLNSHLNREFDLVPCSRKDQTGYRFTRTLAEVPTADVLLHLGEDSNIRRVNSKAWPDIETSYIQFCELVKNKSFSQIIYLSSCVVERYSGTSEYARVDDIIKAPNYIRLKLLMEKEVMSLGGTVIRVPNLYGNVLVSGTILHDIYTQIVNDGTYTLNDPRALIRFFHVQDLIFILESVIKEGFSGFINLNQGPYYKADDVAAYMANCLMNRGIDVQGKTTVDIAPDRIIGEAIRVLDCGEHHSLDSALVQLIEKYYEN